LHFGAAGTTPSIDDLPPLGKLFSLSTKKTQTIIEEVCGAATEFPSHCDAFGVPPQDTEVLFSRIKLLK
jgi:hypothetical protein